MKHKNLQTFPILTTENLVLRQLSESDVREIFILRSDPAINKYLDRQPASTLDEALAFIIRIKENSLSYWAITQKANDQLVGTICLFDISAELQKCELGYELLTGFQGKGIMREAVSKVVEYSAETLALKTIDAFTHKDNQSSIRLLEDMKFVRTDLLDKENPDMMLYRLTITA